MEDCGRLRGLCACPKGLVAGNAGRPQSRIANSRRTPRRLGIPGNTWNLWSSSWPLCVPEGPWWQEMPEGHKVASRIHEEHQDGLGSRVTHGRLRSSSWPLCVPEGLGGRKCRKATKSHREFTKNTKTAWDPG